MFANKSILFVCIFFCLCVYSQDCPDWSYSGSNGPEFWGSLCSAYTTCSSGTSQSPINLVRSNSNNQRIILDVDYSRENNLEFFNNGHTVEVSYVGTGDNEVFTNSDSYELEQFHFHTPSEHTVNGDHYDMEVHFVHANLDTDVDLLVIGVFVNAPDDDEECDFLSQLISSLPESETDDEEVDIDTLIDFDDDTEFYSYSGSLTTPPCSEIVSWFIKSEPIRCSRSQVEEFSDILGSSNRPTRPRNSRAINYGSNNQNSNSNSGSSSSSSNSNSGSSSSNSSSDANSICIYASFIFFTLFLVL